jgi:hypothetical protein
VRWPLASKIIDGEEVMNDEAISVEEPPNSDPETVFDNDVPPSGSTTDILDE